MTRSILAACMVAVSLSAPVAAQPLTYLHGDIADSPIAYQCIVNGAPMTCSVPIVPYCEKHKDQILYAPPLAQTCIRAEQAEEQRRRLAAGGRVLMVPVPDCQDPRNAKLGACHPLPDVCRDAWMHPGQPLPAICTKEAAR